MRSDVTPTTHHAQQRIGALGRRWPAAVGAAAAIAMVLDGGGREGLTTVVLIAVSCYLAAAVTGRPWMAWAWIVPGSLLVVASRALDVAPLLVHGAAAVALVVVGLVRGASRPALARQTAGFVGYGLLVVAALALPPGPGLVLAALALIGHAGWDVWHLRRHRDEISPSLAEACVVLDVLFGVVTLVLAVVI